MSEQCNAKLRSGGRCTNPPMVGRKRCRMHGGKTPIGIGSPHFKDGKRSKYTAIGLGERIRQAAGDPGLLELRSTVAAVDVRIAELVAMIEAAQADTPTGEGQTDLDMGALWEALAQSLERKARLVEAESKRLRLLNQYVPAETFLGFFAYLEQVLRQNVADPKALQAIGDAIQGYAITYRLGTNQTIDQDSDQEVDN